MRYAGCEIKKLLSRDREVLTRFNSWNTSSDKIISISSFLRHITTSMRKMLSYSMEIIYHHDYFWYLLRKLTLEQVQFWRLRPADVRWHVTQLSWSWTARHKASRLWSIYMIYFKLKLSYRSISCLFFGLLKPNIALNAFSSAWFPVCWLPSSRHLS